MSKQKNNSKSKQKLPADPRTFEKMSANILRYMEKQQFKNETEVKQFMDGLIGKEINKEPPKTALDLAQDICYEAWETDDRQERIRLAQEALRISPNCADAYVILAEDKATTLAEAKAYYREGVLAGERALGKERFKKDKGHFWGIIQTRPYMRARAGLAQCLWEESSYDEAIAHYKDMLKLNPNDNQGIRYLLAACFAEISRYDDLKKLLFSGKYKNDCGLEWLYTKALLIFKEEGPSDTANSLLEAALKRNAFAVDYLIGKKGIPRYLPDSITVGGEDEGFCYAANFVDMWRKTLGAIDWLKQRAGIRTLPKVGRNEPCPCGSGKKYKKCCGK